MRRDDMKENFQDFLADFIKDSTCPDREYLSILWIKAESAIEIYPNEYPWIVVPNEKKTWLGDRYKKP